jgi:hypothetical protein
MPGCELLRLPNGQQQLTFIYSTIAISTANHCATRGQPCLRTAGAVLAQLEPCCAASTLIVRLWPRITDTPTTDSFRVLDAHL